MSNYDIASSGMHVPPSPTKWNERDFRVQEAEKANGTNQCYFTTLNTLFTLPTLFIIDPKKIIFVLVGGILKKCHIIVITWH